MTFEQLREKHPQFIYEGFEILTEDDKLKIYFNFEVSPDIRFRPEVILPIPDQQQNLDNLVFNWGMVELLSYWKAACPPEIIIKAGNLNQEQISFWKNLLVKGLGEFFYTNKIDFTKDDLVTFKVRSHIPSGKQVNQQLKDRDLVLVSGGKDSTVTLEILKNSQREFSCLVLNPTDAALKICELGECKNPIIVKRTIDSKLLELNNQGYLNGHTPFSALLAFLSTLTATVYNYKNIIVSNEASANEGDIEYLGQTINHQYSKSFEFENNFREYSNKYLADTSYFSILRPLSELQISQLFAQISKYHQVFKSCNRGSKTNTCCGSCPKCLSTYLTLYPFLGTKTQHLFGKNILGDESLIPIVKGLLREENAIKPFECVATVEEIRVAIFLAIERAKQDSQPIPKVLQAVKNQALDKREILKYWNHKNNLPYETYRFEK